MQLSSLAPRVSSLPPEIPRDLAGARAVAERHISRSSPIERNRDITRSYAALYLERPETFKWAGVAAFASYQVGVALELFPLCCQRRELALFARPGIELLKETNDSVYADLAWAHLVYLRHGFSVLCEAFAGVEKCSLMVEGFRCLHDADQLRARGEPAGRIDDLVWRGTSLLLEHEQRFTVQPRFERMSSGFRMLVGVAALVDFALDGSDRQVTSFLRHARATRPANGVAASAWPRASSFAQRWAWIEEEVLPDWRRTERFDLELPERMRRLATAPEELDTITRARLTTAFSLLPETYRDLWLSPRALAMSETKPGKPGRALRARVGFNRGVGRETRSRVASSLQGILAITPRARLTTSWTAARLPTIATRTFTQFGTALRWFPERTPPRVSTRENARSSAP